MLEGLRIGRLGLSACPKWAKLFHLQLRLTPCRRQPISVSMHRMRAVLSGTSNDKSFVHYHMFAIAVLRYAHHFPCSAFPLVVVHCCECKNAELPTRAQPAAKTTMVPIPICALHASADDMAVLSTKDANTAACRSLPLCHLSQRLHACIT